MAAATKKKKPTRKPAAKKKAAPAAARARSGAGAPRKDHGAPIDAYFARQSPEQRALLETLRGLVEQAFPHAQTAIKWGVPFFLHNGKMVCALAAFKQHVVINIFAPPDTLVDPKGLLEGASQGARALKVRQAKDIDRASVLRWVKTALAHAG
jgi:hypothetical protein